MGKTEQIPCTICGVKRMFSGGFEQPYYEERFKKAGITKEEFIKNYICRQCKSKNKRSKEFCLHNKGLSRELDGRLTCMVCMEVVKDEA